MENGDTVPAAPKLRSIGATGFGLALIVLLAGGVTGVVSHGILGLGLVGFGLVALVSYLGGQAVARRDRSAGALPEQVERLRTTLASIGDAVITTDTAGRITNLNAVAETLTGWTDADAIGLDLDAVFKSVNETTRRTVGNPATRALREGVIVGLANHTILIARDGTERPIDDSAAPIRLQDGAVVGCVLVFRDTSERHRQEAELKERERQFRTLAESIPQLAWMANADGYIVWYNRRWYEYTGTTLEQMQGWGWQSVHDPDELPNVLERWNASIATGASFDMIFPLKGSDGRFRPFLTRVEPVKDETGRVVQWFGTNTDISDQKQAEADRSRLLLQAEDERQRLADVFRQAPAFMCVLRGPDHVFEIANERYFQLVGHRDSIGKPIREALPEIEGQGYFEMLDQVYRTGTPVSGSGDSVLISRLPGQPPEQLLVDFVYQPLRDADGMVTGIVIVGVDVTERQNVQAQLQQNEQFNRSLMDGTADCVKVLDLDGRLLHMNSPGMCAMEIDDFGSVCGREWDDLWPVEAQGDIKRSLARAVVGEVSSFEAYCPTAKGTPKWWDVTVSPVRDAEGGRIVRLLSVSREITERRQVEQALHDSEQRLRAATAAVSDLIWTNNPDGLMEGEQRGWGDFTGQTREQYQGYGWSKAVHPDDAQPTLEAWTRAVAEKRTFVFEHRVRRRDGEWRLCAVRAVPIFNADHTIREWVGVHADVTERRNGEEELRKLAAELSESSLRKDEFLATLAHELRNPLAPIRTGLKLMKLAAGQEETIETARAMVERQVTQMVRLVDDLMDVSRISRGTLELRKERIALATVVGSAVETSLPLIEQMGHQLTVVLPEQPLLVDADITRLAQVILNLLNNAAKYADRGGRIALKVERQKSDAVVTVTDTGIGIAAGQIPRIFDMFTQLDGATDKSQGGLGIGLALVKRLVEMHDGSVEARSAGPGKGSEFIVRLPCVTGDPDSPAAGDAAEPPSRSMQRILVVDDNRDGADSLSQMLKMMGHDTRTAYDGQEGVDVAAEFQPNVVLLDIGLPKLNGYEACRRIRGQAWSRDAVFIAVTGWGQEEDRRRSREAGFELHLVKPVDPQVLMGILGGLQVAKRT